MEKPKEEERKEIIIAALYHKENCKAIHKKGPAYSTLLPLRKTEMVAFSLTAASPENAFSVITWAHIVPEAGFSIVNLI